MADFFLIAMSLFEHNYNGLVAYAKGIIRNSGLNIDPDDIINDAYIDLVNSKRDYNRDEFKRLMSKIAFKQTDGRLIQLDDFRKTSVTPDQISCNKCRQAKPIGAFEIMKVKGFEYPRKTCKACVYERVKERRKISPPKPYCYKTKPVPLALQMDKERKRGHSSSGGRKKIYKYKGHSLSKEARKIQFTSWLNKDGNRLKFNLYMKDRLKHDRETLSDSYIKMILKRSDIYFSADAVIKKRKELLLKREMRPLKNLISNIKNTIKEKTNGKHQYVT